MSNETASVGIGSTVWVFDINRRKYRERGPGERFASGPPIWREHWVPQVIVGETSRSWILEYGDKVPKKGADPQVVSFSRTDIDRAAYVNDNSHLIAHAVGNLKDYELLRRVADLIGHEANETP